MNLLAPKPMTVDDFLIWEERQEMRYEFDGFGPVAMTGGTAGHVTIQGNLALAFGTRLRGKQCRFYGSDLKFHTAQDHIRYPDGMIVCEPVDRKATFVRNPTVVFEVLSPSAERTDKIRKAREYEATPSVQRYVMLEQDEIGAVVYARAGDIWTHELLETDGVLSLPEVEIAFPLAELYEGVTFE